MKVLLAFGLLLCAFGAIARDSSEEDVSVRDDTSEEVDESDGGEVKNEEYILQNTKNIIRSDGNADPIVDSEKKLNSDNVTAPSDDAHKYTIESIFPNFDFNNILDSIGNILNPGNRVGLNPSSRAACSCGGRDRSGASENAVEINEFPWTAQIIREVDGSLLCAGSIVSNMHIMTAAHCVVDYPNNAQAIVVRVGTKSRRFFEGSQFLVSIVIVHENYNNVQDNNIAILILQRPIEFTNNIGAVCIPSANFPFDDQPGMVTTWGSAAPIGSVSNILFRDNIIMRNFRYCRWTFGYRFLEINSNVICASQSGRDGCQGFNGGVLISDDASSSSYQVGIASFGVGCEVERFAVVYTNVIRFRDWIMNIIPEENRCSPPSVEDIPPANPVRRRRPN